MEITHVEVRSILTRTTGYLHGIATHSLQPYRGCSFGNSLCGVGCYVQHNFHVTKGREWGGFLEVRDNAAAAYREYYEREKKWGRRREERFGIFFSSATDPFVPQEHRFGISRSLLDAMIEFPPDHVIVQTHTHNVLREADRIVELAKRTAVRLHISIETDHDRIEGLPPHASPIAARFDAARHFRSAGVPTVVTVAPLLPMADPESFFRRAAECADAVVIDHFIQGDGSDNGQRTRKTQLPIVMSNLLAGSADLAYRDAIVSIARTILPGRVGVGRDGFAGKFI